MFVAWARAREASMLSARAAEGSASTLSGKRLAAPVSVSVVASLRLDGEGVRTVDHYLRSLA